MLRKLTGIARAMATAFAVVAIATSIEATSVRAEVAPLTEADLQIGRGTVLAIDMESRTMVVETVEGGDFAFQVADGVQGFSTLKVGTKVELRFYRIVDVLVARTTTKVTQQARALLADPNQAPDIPGTKRKARLWGAAGMATRVDTAAKKMDVAQGGLIYHTPTIRTAAGVATLQTFKPGDMVTLLFTERTAVEIKPIQ